MKQTAFWRK